MSSSLWLCGLQQAMLSVLYSRSLSKFMSSELVMLSNHLIICLFLPEMLLYHFQFSGRDLQSFPFYCFPLFLWIVHLRRPSYLSSLFSGTLHSVGSIFPFFPCLSPFCFPQSFVKAPQTTTLPSCISVILVTAFWTVLQTSIHNSSGTLSTRSKQDTWLLIFQSLL